MHIPGSVQIVPHCSLLPRGVYPVKPDGYHIQARMSFACRTCGLWWDQPFETLIKTDGAVVCPECGVHRSFPEDGLRVVARIRAALASKDLRRIEAEGAALDDYMDTVPVPLRRDHALCYAAAGARLLSHNGALMLVR